ncbi:glycyl-glycine endopeptidase ALE-1-like [Macrobrachium nipponense]|uniref:glycyl-glycine endopeptidase ALE-1-like n=1 Tax=Macrobrachium nipponense TaxID=159736 RepID=UPI0030C7AB3A
MQMQAQWPKCSSQKETPFQGKEPEELAKHPEIQSLSSYGDCLPPSASFLFGTDIATAIQATSGPWLAASVAGVPGSQEAIASAKEGDSPQEACTSARTDMHSKLFTPVKTDVASKETDAPTKADAALEEVDASAKADAASKEAGAPAKADAASKEAGAPPKADAASKEASAPAKADAASEEAGFPCNFDLQDPIIYPYS